MQVYKRILRTFSILLFGAGQEVAFQVLSAFIWIGAWGIDLYSDWIILFIFPNLITRGNAGIFHAASSSLIILFGRKSYGEASEIYSALKICQLLMLVFIAIVAMGFTSTLILTDAIKHINSTELLVINILLFLQIVLFHYHQQELCLLKAAEKASKAALWQGYFRLGLIVPMLSLPAFFPLMVCLMVAVVFQFVLLLITRNLTSDSKEILPESTVVQSKIKQLFIQGLQFSSLPFTQTAIHSLCVWSLGFFVAPSVGAAWHNMRTMSRGILIIARALEQSVRWEMSLMFSKEQTNEAIKILKKAVLTSFLALSFISLVLIVIGERIFNLITHNALEFSLEVFSTLCVGSLFYSLSQVYLSIPFATNNYDKFISEYIKISLIVLLLVAPFSTINMALLALLISTSDLVVLIRSRSFAKKIIREF